MYWLVSNTRSLNTHRDIPHIVNWFGMWCLLCGVARTSVHCIINSRRRVNCDAPHMCNVGSVGRGCAFFVGERVTRERLVGRAPLLLVVLV